MTDIAEFLTARLDDDEAYARNAAEEFGPDWIEIWSGVVDLTASLPDRQPPAGSHWDTHVVTNDSGVSRHMVRHDPTRVLAEVAAKRRVLARHCPADPRPMWMPPGAWRNVCACIGCGQDRDGDPNIEDINDCPELRDLAVVYADHPDYDESWRP